MSESLDVAILIQGLVLGLSIAAPVGPIGVLCIRRTLANGQVAGLVSGLGAATADAMYGTIAAFGITFVSGVLIDQQTWIRLIGGAFLCYLGLRTFFAHASDSNVAVRGNGWGGAYFSVFFLTLTNPMTIISFAAIFAGIGIGAGTGHFSAILLVLGVFLGSALWWFILSGGVSLLRSRVNATRLQWVNRISGVILVTFGLVAIASILL